MIVRRVRRESDSKLVAAVTHATYDGGVPDVAMPDGLWDIVIQRHAGTTVVLQTGLMTRPIELDCAAGEEHLSISFKPGVFMPRLPGAGMLDRSVVRPTASNRSFVLDGDVLEIPTFENAEGLVEAMVRRGIIVSDDVVERVAQGRPSTTSARTVQRRFRWTLGLSATQLHQIERACRAVTMLQEGTPPADVAADLDYADQPHLTRSLKRFAGRTPREIASSHLGMPV